MLQILNKFYINLFVFLLGSYYLKKLWIIVEYIYYTRNEMLLEYVDNNKGSRWFNKLIIIT